MPFSFLYKLFNFMQELLSLSICLCLELVWIRIFNRLLQILPIEKIDSVVFIFRCKCSDVERSLCLIPDATFRRVLRRLDENKEENRIISSIKY